MSQFVILFSPNCMLPTLISSQDLKYAELIKAGYTEYERGSKFLMEQRIIEITEHFYECLV